MQHSSALCRLALMVAAAAALPHVCDADEVRNFLVNGGGENVTGEVPADWHAASRPAPGLRMWRDSESPRTGKACLAVVNAHDYGQPVSNNWAQKQTDVPAGKTLRLTGYIRTENADAANICVQCWGPDGEKMVAFSSTPVFRGTHDWTFAQAREIVVPQQATSVTVRAALTGKGKAFFDDLMLEIFDGRAANDPFDGQIASRNPRVLPNDQLDLLVAGRIVRMLPVIKDCMVLSYHPEWNHGDLDNIGMANHDGGVRTLLKWEPPTADEVSRPGRRFVLAVYGREAKGTKPARVQLHPIQQEWDENLSWEDLPRFAPEPAASVEWTRGKGWKLFDVTSFVRSQVTQPNLGVVLRFAEENRREQDEDSCEYEFVSREGIGEWTSHRPVLLIVDPNSPTSGPADVKTASKRSAAQTATTP